MFSVSSPDPGATVDLDSAPASAGEPTVVGIDVGGTKTAIALATVSGTVLATTRISTAGDERPEGLFARITAATAALVAEGFAAPSAVALASPGIATPSGVQLTPNIAGWDSLPLASTLSDAFPAIPTTVMNDVRAATFAELRSGALVGVRDGVYLNIGTGLSSGLVVDGRIVQGHRDAAGEIGYQVLNLAEPAYAAGRAPLEEAFSGLAMSRSLDRDAAAHAPAADDSTVPERIRLWLTQNVDHLALALANLCIALNPQRVVLGGGVASGAPYLLELLDERLRNTVPFPPEIVLSTMPDDAALRGTLAAAARLLDLEPAT